MPGLLVTVHRDQLVALGKHPDGAITRFWLRLLADVDARAKRKLSNDYLHVRTGNLRSSQQTPFITYDGDTIIGVAQNVATYAAALHNGSRPHEIRPRRVKMLRFPGRDGAPTFRSLVHHPGTKAKPWLRDALNETIEAHAR